MINTVIIEDEKCAQEKLLNLLAEVSDEVNVIGILGSVKESIDYFKTSLPIDLIFCDVQLEDGLSFDIFAEIHIKIPVIFTTGFDKFLLYAFENNGIDYLLKPIHKEDLSKALLKYKMFKDHFLSQHQSIYRLRETLNMKKKIRLLVKKGIEYLPLQFEDIALFYTENKLVYVIDKNGRKYITDKTLNELELELDDSVFFRANRQYIINLNFVRSFKAYEKVKLQVDLHLPETGHLIVISQNSAPDFRKWISTA
ncbi:MAG: LytTR family DNA-binding domain-containing protein [Ginsengibacter sp.]